MKAGKIHFRVEILNEEIILENGIRHARTAILEKWKDNYQLSSRKLGAPSVDEIYQQIKKKEAINLDYCYLKDFSLGQYRKSHGMTEIEVVELLSFSASNAFFESSYGTDFSYSLFDGDNPSFAYSIFNHGKVNFGHAKCESNMNFNRAEFYLEELSFRFAEFENGDVRFSSCIFDCEDVLFVNTNFGSGNVSFRQSDFMYSNCNFQYCRFDKGDVSFDKAIFKGNEIDFRKIEFGDGKAEFRRVDFGDGNINFNESEFKTGKINFRNSTFGTGYNTFENIDFGQNEVQFDGLVAKGGHLSFKGSSFNSISFTDSMLYGHCDFRVRKGNLLDFSYSIFKDILDFQPSDEQVELKTLKIEGIKNMGKIFISWNSNNVYQLITSQKESSLYSKAEQFNLLKESFNSNGKYSSEDKAYVAFKRFEMKANLERDKKKGLVHHIRGSVNYGFQWLVFDKAGLFATSPLRVFTSMLIVLSFFSFIYVALPFFSDSAIVSSVGDPDKLNSLERSFYHSAITFFTIGYGDFYPSGHVRWLSSVEGWAGVFLMSYFTVAFVRKILR